MNQQKPLTQFLFGRNKMSIYLVIILILVSNQPKEYFAFAISFEKILDSFRNVLNYSLLNADFTDLSGIFGVVRAEALLADIFKRNGQLSIVKDILKVKKYILLPYNEWVKNISSPSVWKTKISYKWLEEKCFHHSNKNTKLILNKLRNEVETACITPEMFDYCANHSYYTENRHKIDPGCSYFFMGNYKGIGFETTHRLLFIQILKIWNYYSNSQVMSTESLCKYIYQQASATQGKFLFFDLFLEQIFLCGVEGYKEFLNTKWLKIVLDNQLEEGCFPLFSKKKIFNNSSVYNGQCSDHSTGLALATLALHIHYRSQSNSVMNKYE